MTNLKKIILVVVLAAALVGLTYIVKTRSDTASMPELACIKTNENIKDKVLVLKDYVRYPGKNGKNAFDLLQDATDSKVTFKRYDFGVFVEAINGSTPSEKQFWKLYVNCQESTVGADKLETKKGDIVEWFLEDIEEGNS
ncbi:MAG: DUF4430 domain-containing protein [bacterium]|nr:DUF4430 domain-containing protein [bacterium]